MTINGLVSNLTRLCSVHNGHLCAQNNNNEAKVSERPSIIIISDSLLFYQNCPMEAIIQMINLVFKRD
jgi:hypothetical protein